MHVSYHADAAREVVEAARYYGTKAGRLGSEFLDEVDAAVARILLAPERLPVVCDDLRICRLMRFPYGIFYRVTTDGVRILIVKHLHRDPEYGVERN